MYLSITSDRFEIRDDGTFLHVTMAFRDNYPNPSLMMGRDEAAMLRDALTHALKETSDATD